MKVIAHNSDFSEIQTAVFYKFNNFVPSSVGMSTTGFNILKGRFKSDKVQYYGTNDRYFEGSTFSEYNFTQIVEKAKYNENFPLNFLDVASKEIIGKDLGSIELANAGFFPTNSNIDLSFLESGDYTYFGTLSSTATEGLMFYLFSLDEQYWKVELYEDILTTNVVGSNYGYFVDYDFASLANFSEDELIKPAVTIQLGPSSNVVNCLDTYYLNGRYRYIDQLTQFIDPMLENRTDIDNPNVDPENAIGVRLDSKSYYELWEEIFSKKILYFLLSPDRSSLSFSLFAGLLPYEKNPGRNMPNYYVRNDTYFGTYIRTNRVKQSSGLLMDRATGILLGNKKPSNSPILNIKLKQIDNKVTIDGVEYEVWKADKIYSKNELCAIDGVAYSSICDGNLGHDPRITNAWSTSLGTSVSRIIVDWRAEAGGKISPAGILRVHGIKIFRITPTTGYVIDPVNPISDNYPSVTTRANYVTTSGQEKDGVYYPVGDGFEFRQISYQGKKYIEAIVNKFSWTDSNNNLVGPSNTGYLIFNFIRTTINFPIVARSGETLKTFSQWDWTFSGTEEDFSVSTYFTVDYKYDNLVITKTGAISSENTSGAVTSNSELQIPFNSDVVITIPNPQNLIFSSASILINTSSISLDSQQTTMTINDETISASMIEIPGSYITSTGGSITFVVSNIQYTVNVAQGTEDEVSYTYSFATTKVDTGGTVILELYPTYDENNFTECFERRDCISIYDAGGNELDTFTEILDYTNYNENNPTTGLYLSSTDTTTAIGMLVITDIQESLTIKVNLAQ